ncbi:uncharacterized protein AMSG_06776 [Thecamonas trahens ATCC 50062]|uniref:Uncharacterized protein n=1 Tax=Thecamonas trahens ATCC 50062 TaxID=461836 RepID=A0A0L0DDJ8_THETB|nr:hypothetical protein AMSG_06776 [Thecamonas trahens ATCC 50062]KNC50295.1 hypothetical protein AMSG_06776 [Thecamonas trahens ATCC 50062]|eukprot:XP_013756842.1 hypothetical protein AMSG_06776 [Thecamonas trahens ATCC 50062]
MLMLSAAVTWPSAAASPASITSSTGTAAVTTTALTKGECKGFVLGHLEVNVATEEGTTSLDVKVGALAVECAGDWHVQEDKFPHLHGSGSYDLAIGDGSRLDLAMGLHHMSANFPSSVSVEDCTAVVELAKVEFHGGVVADLMDFVIKLLHKQLQVELQFLLCSKVAPDLASKMSLALDHVADEVGTCVAERRATPPPPLPPPPPGGLINLRTNPVVALLDYVVNNVSTSVGLDALVDELTDDGYYAVDLNTTLAVALLDNTLNITIELGELALNGLDTWQQLDTLRPASWSPYVLSSSISADALAANISFCVAASATALAGDGVFTDCGVLSGRLAGATLDISTYVAIDAEFLSSLDTSQYLSPGNLLASVDAVSLESLWFNASFVDVVVYGLNGTAGSELNTAALETLRFLEYGFAASLPGTLDCVVVPLVEPEINHALASELKTLKAQYPQSGPQEQEEAFSHLAIVIALAFFVVASTTSLGWLAYVGKTAKDDDDLPLALALDVSPVVTSGLVVLIWANLACVINVSAGTVAFLFAFFDVGGREAHLPSLFSFTLKGSVQDFWDAKVYPPAILLAVFSGGWTYIKHSVLAGSLLLRPSWFPRRVRLLALHLTQMMGTWILVSIYSIYLVMITLHVKLIAPPGAPSGQTFTVDVAVEPTPLMYVEVATLCACLFFSHLVLKLHRNEARRHQLVTAGAISPAGVALVLNGAECGSPGSTPLGLARDSAVGPPLWRKASVGATVFVAVTSVVTLACVSIAAVVPLFSIELDGAIAYVLGVLEQPSSEEYSLYDVGEAFVRATHKSNFGIIVLQVLYYIASLVLPLVATLLAVVLWFVPLSLAWQRRLAVAVEVTCSWSAVDVAVISLVAGLAQLHTFIGFVVGPQCAALNPILNEYLSEPLKGNTVCLAADATLMPASYVLVAGAVAFVALSVVVFVHTHAHVLGPSVPASDDEPSSSGYHRLN